MLRTSSRQVGRCLSRPCSATIRLYSSPIRVIPQTSSRGDTHRPTTRLLHAGLVRNIGITESADKPDEAPTPQQSDRPTQPTPIGEDDFHVQSDLYFERLLEKLEDIQEERGDLDVEYSAGVLTIMFPPIGTYVLNKQPPNKQIWLSSPVSGPKRFDWVVAGESMHQKEGMGGPEWIYLRDGSGLSDILKKELNVDLGDPYEQ